MTAIPTTSTRASSSPLFAHLIPSLILAVIATVLFWWNPFGAPPKWATFHVRLKSDVAGQVRLLHDVDGTGLHKGKLLSQPVEGGNRVNDVQFRIPAGKLCAFVLTALDRPGEVELLECSITTQSGEVAATISPRTIAESVKGASLNPADGSVHFRTEGGDASTGFHYTPMPPLELSNEPPPPDWQIVLVFVATWIGGVLASTALVSRREKLGRAVSAARLCIESRPLRTILVAALLGVTTCAFPVIFGGKSYVSPNNGMPLLYEKFPTVPGAPDEGIENPTGSDMGATLYWHHPASMIAYRALFRDGEFPLWNRYNWNGLTFFGQGMSMVGDPLHWITIVTNGAAWAWDLKFILAKIIFAFGVGLLVLRTSRCLPAALLLTISAPFMGFFAYRFCHVATFSLCYAPWILVAWVEAVRAATARRAALWAGVLLAADWWQLNSGTAKEASAFLVFLNATGGLMLLFSAQPWRWRVQRLALFGWATVLFMLLSAPFWVVFLDALGKAWTVYNEPQIYQLQPGLAIGLFDDIFQRQLMPMEFLFSPSTNFFVLLGVAWALIRVRALVCEPGFLAPLLLSAAAAALAFGVVPPSAAAAIPLIKNIYHFDNTFSCVLFILFFILAGFGLRECLARRDKAEWVGDWICVLALFGVLLASYFGFVQATHRAARSMLAPGESLPKSAFFIDYVTVLVIAFAALPLAFRAAFRNRIAAPAWSLVAALLFATLHFRHGMHFETRFDLYTMNPKARMNMSDIRSPAIERLRALSTEPARVMGLDWTLTPGFNTALGLETISGPDALMSPEMIELTGALGIPRTYAWRNIASSKGYPKIRRSLDLLNVRYLLTDPTEPPIPGLQLRDSADLKLYESETAWPRAFFTDTYEKYRDVSELAHRVDAGDGRPFAALPADLYAKMGVPPKTTGPSIVNAAQKYHLTNNTTAFEIDAPSAGVAVLMEANVPGDVQAYVDGQAARCFSVDHIFRGVAIERPGHHTVKFAYWPRALGPALWVAAVGGIALLISLWVLLRRHPATAGTVSAEIVSPTCLTTSP
jgi:hypothetical protein